MYTSDLPLVKLEVSDVAPNRVALSQFWVICVCFDNILYYGLFSGSFIVIVILFWSFLQTLFSFWIIRFPLVSLPCVSLCLCDRCVPRPIMSPLICCSSTPLSVLRSFISCFIVKVICSMFSAFSLSSLVSSCLTCVNCVPHVFSVPSSLYCVFNPLPPSVQCCVLPHSCVFPRVLPHVFVIIFHSQQIKLCAQPIRDRCCYARQNAQIWYSMYPMLKSATAACTSTPQSKQPCQWKNNNRRIFIAVE